MRSITNILLFAVLAMGLVVFIKFFIKGEKQVYEEANTIINQIEEVNKLITVEGNLAEIYTFKETQKLFFDLIPVSKKAIVIAKAKVYISYDMNKMKYEVDEDSKTLTITNLPEQQVIIDPELSFYDLKRDVLTGIGFSEGELNKLNKRAIELLKNKIAQSSFSKVARQSLQNNLERITLLTNSSGWKVEGVLEVES